MTKDTAECRALVMAFLSSSYAGSEDDERKVCAALDELDALRSRPSGLALEWDEHNEAIIGGGIVAGSVLEFDGRWFAFLGTDPLDDDHDTKEAAQAAVERAVRSALGDHIADAGKMVAPLPNTEGNDG